MKVILDLAEATRGNTQDEILSMSKALQDAINNADGFIVASNSTRGDMGRGIVWNLNAMEVAVMISAILDKHPQVVPLILAYITSTWGDDSDSSEFLHKHL